MEREALKLALEALEVYWGKAEHRRTKEDESKAIKAITAIKEALAQPPQREWVGLTAQEAAECWTTSAVQIWENFEAKLKEKNT